jgi:hypothetical protein
MRSFALKLSVLTVAAAGTASLVAAPGAAAAEPGATCASNNGVATLSPGISETAQVQNITLKGTLGECTGEAGSSAKYVIHVKSSTPVTCVSLAAGGLASEGTAILKWGHGKGNSLGTVSVSGSPTSGFSLTGSIAEGPYAGLHIAETMSGTSVFSGKGEACTKKNKLKRITVSGTTPTTIS